MMTILYMEDSPTDVRLLKIFLQEIDLECNLLIAETLQEGRQMLQSPEIDLLITSLTFPDSRGLETVEAIVRGFPNIRFFVLTGHDSDLTKQRALELGARAYLMKGVFDQEVLKATILAAFDD